MKYPQYRLCVRADDSIHDVFMHSNRGSRLNLRSTTLDEPIVLVPRGDKLSRQINKHLGGSLKFIVTPCAKSWI
jgi:hypothetical protein